MVKHELRHRAKAIYFILLLLSLTGCQTLSKTFYGMGSGLQQDGKATMAFLNKAADWFVQNVW